MQIMSLDRAVLIGIGQSKTSPRWANIAQTFSKLSFLHVLIKIVLSFLKDALFLIT